MRQSSIATGTILSVNDLHTKHHAKTLLLPFPTLKDRGRESIPTSLNSFPQATSLRSSHYNHSPVSPIRDLLRCSFAMVISCISTDVSCARAHVCLLYPKILWMYVSSSVGPNFVHGVTHLSQKGCELMKLLYLLLIVWLEGWSDLICYRRWGCRLSLTC